jgi:V/A-type H+/Na+-transporting ATPase subunit K
MITLASVYALVGVGLAVGFGAIGSAYGSGTAAKVGASLLSKEPEKFAQILVLSALPSTQALFGLLFGFIIMIQSGLLGGEPAVEMTDLTGLAYLASSIPVSIACLFSGVMQGQVAASAVSIVAHKPENLTQGIALASIIESFAIFGLVISLLIVFVGIGG